MPQENNNIQIPEWMKQQENFTSKTDREGFLTKSLLGFLKIFRHFHIEKNENMSVICAGFRTVLVLEMILLLSLSHHVFFCGFLTASYMVLLCFSRLEVLKRCLSTSLFAALFTALIMLPSFFIYISYSFITITLKVFISTGMISLFSQTTPWNKITAALRFVKFPPFLIFILDLTIHYILILGNAAYDILFALKLRSVGKNSNKQKSFSGVAGVVFLKSISITRETQQAMECRLFDGTYRSMKSSPKLKDFIPVVLMLLYLLLFIYTC